MITIELPEEDALVLFEFLARHDELDSGSDGEMTQLVVEDRAELWALLQLHGALECILVESFSPEYSGSPAPLVEALGP